MVGREGAVGLQSAFGQRLSFTRAMVQVGGRFYAISAEQLRLALSEEIKALVYRYILLTLRPSPLRIGGHFLFPGTKCCARRLLYRGAPLLRGIFVQVA